MPLLHRYGVLPGLSDFHNFHIPRPGRAAGGLPASSPSPDSALIPPCELEEAVTAIVPALDSPDVLGLIVDADDNGFSALRRLGSLLSPPPPVPNSPGSSSTFGSPQSGHLHGNSSLRPKIKAPPPPPVVFIISLNAEVVVVVFPPRGMILNRLGRRTCTRSHGRRRSADDARMKAVVSFFFPRPFESQARWSWTS